MLPFAIGAFSFAVSFTKDWKGVLKTLDEGVKTQQMKATEITKEVIEFVRTHSNMTQLSLIGSDWLDQ